MPSSINVMSIVYYLDMYVQFIFNHPNENPHSLCLMVFQEISF